MQPSELYFHIEDYLLFCKSKNLARKTIRSYEQTLKLFERWARDEGIDNIDKITPTIIIKYIRFLQTRGKYEVVTNDNSRRYNYPENRTDLGKPITATTVNNYIRNMKAFFTYCCEFDLIKENPMRKLNSYQISASLKTSSQMNSIKTCYAT